MGEIGGVTYLTHGNSCLYSTSNCIYTTRETKKIDVFALLSDSIGCVNPGTFGIALLECLGIVLNVRSGKKQEL